MRPHYISYVEEIGRRVRPRVDGPFDWVFLLPFELRGLWNGLRMDYNSFAVLDKWYWRILHDVCVGLAGPGFLVLLETPFNEKWASSYRDIAFLDDGLRVF